MSVTHAVVWTDHQAAQVLRLDADHVKAEKVHASSHYTRQHHSEVRTQHEFFSEVCGALDGIDAVLVTGSHTAVADFRHYAEKHGHQRLRASPGTRSWITPRRNNSSRSRGSIS